MELKNKNINTLIILFIYFPINFFILQYGNMILNINITKMYEIVILVFILLSLDKVYNKLILSFIVMITVIHGIGNFGVNDFNMAYKFILALLTISLFTNKEIMSKFKISFDYRINRIIKYINYIHIVLLISLLFPICYVNKWGEEGYFQGPFDSPHQMGYFLMGIMFILTYIYKKKNNKKMFLLLNIDLILVLLTGVRTVLIGTGIIYGISFIYYIKKSKKNIIISIILISIAIILSSQFITDIPMISKMKYTGESKYTNLISGRDTIWKNNLNAYNEFPIIKKIIGCGMGVTFKVNLETIGKKIWAHNDIIQILLAYGILGIILYLIVIFRLFNKYKSIIIASFIIIIMISNGVMNYNNFVLMLPFILLSSKTVRDFDKNYRG